MSKHIDQREDGTLEVTMADPNLCAWMYNDVCCNRDSDEVCNWPTYEYCENCPFFAPEDEEEAEYDE